jgi:hypothetical protein
MSFSIDSPSVSLLWSIKEALRRGDQQTAHQLAIRLTTSDPANEHAWLWYAVTAESIDDSIGALTRAVLINPNNFDARQQLHDLMQRQLRLDAFLRYDSETIDLYAVRTRNDRLLIQPKDRAPFEIYPPTEQLPSHIALRWLIWSLIGLLPAGLGTLICAPIAMSKARPLLRGKTRADRARGQFIFLGALLLLVVAIFFIFLLLLHL